MGAIAGTARSYIAKYEPYECPMDGIAGTARSYIANYES
jgi:hypothetical protein